MDVLGSGLITMFNGFVALLGTLASPMALAVVVVVASLVWLALIEIEELNRQGTKPDVGRH